MADLLRKKYIFAMQIGSKRLVFPWKFIGGITTEWEKNSNDDNSNTVNASS